MTARSLIEAEVRNQLRRSRNALPSLPSIVGNHFEGFMANIACKMIRINDYTSVRVSVAKDQKVRIVVPVFVQKWNTATDNGWLDEVKATLVFCEDGLNSSNRAYQGHLRANDGSIRV